MNTRSLTLIATAALNSIALASSADAGRVNTALARAPHAFVTQPAVKPRLEKLMGLVNARFLQKNFGTTSTLQNAGGVIAVSGCQSHNCASYGALVAYDTRHDAFKVWLTVNGKTRVFADKAFAAALNKDVQAYAANLRY